jgi:parvulin-like peptidyl-prolyl isomerase
VFKNITIRVSVEAARWARRKAAEENTSVSQMLGRILEEQMRQADSYREAYERFKAYRPSSTAGAANRMTREQTHERH